MGSTTIKRTHDYWQGRFDAMASDCEVLVDTDDKRVARRVVAVVADEARRIERKFSRYRDDNIIHRINQNAPVDVDDETAQLLDFAKRCYELSGGRFDITSGVLRRVWKFDGSDRIPTKRDVSALMEHVGWEKVTWEPATITLPAGMEIDLGGIGKEYAVDRAARLVAELTSAGAVVNFGGDLVVTGPRANDTAWVIGIESPDGTPTGDTPIDARKAVVSPQAAGAIEVRRGALATSGSAKRFLEKDGVRYSHVLDPRTGWPVEGAPRSVTVLAGTCSEAGFLTTLALLHGVDAETFLEAQGVRYWCVR